MFSKQIFSVCLIIKLMLRYNNCETELNLKDTICKSNTDHIDAVVQFKDYRYFIIENKYYEYDNDDKYRRKGDLYFLIQDYHYEDTYRSGKKITGGKFLNGVYISQIDCKKLMIPNIKEEEECQLIAKRHFENLQITFIYDQFTDRKTLRLKKFKPVHNKYVGVAFNQCQQKVQSFDSNDEQIDNVLFMANFYADLLCAPYNMSGQTDPQEWFFALISRITNTDTYRFLPLFFDETSSQLIFILNKELAVLKSGQHFVRAETTVYWLVINPFNYKLSQMKSKPMSHAFTYTAFIKYGNDVYLVGERFTESTDRSASILFKFDLKNKQVKEEDSKLFEKLGCSLGSNKWVPILVISALIAILLLVIIGWVFTCYWLYAKEGQTTYAQSIQIEGT